MLLEVIYWIESCSSTPLTNSVFCIVPNALNSTIREDTLIMVSSSIWLKNIAISSDDMNSAVNINIDNINIKVEYRGFMYLKNLFSRSTNRLT